MINYQEYIAVSRLFDDFNISAIRMTYNMNERTEAQVLETIVVQAQQQMAVYSVNSIIVTGAVTGVNSYVALLGYNIGIVQGIVSFGINIFDVQYNNGNLIYYKMSHV